MSSIFGTPREDEIFSLKFSYYRTDVLNSMSIIKSF